MRWKVGKVVYSLVLRLSPRGFLTHLASASLALFLFYTVVNLANLLGVSFFLDYRSFVMNITIFSVFVDKILWVVSGIVCFTLLLANLKRFEFMEQKIVFNGLYVLNLVLSAYAVWSCFDPLSIEVLIVVSLVFVLFLFVNRAWVWTSRKTVFVLTVFYGMVFLLVIEVASVVRWVCNLFFPSLVFADGSWSIAFAEAQIAGLLYPVLDVLLMVFAFSWVGEFVFKGLLTTERPSLSRSSTDSFLRFRSKKSSFVVALVSVALAIFIGYYNLSVAGVYNLAFSGTDIPIYTQNLRSMLNLGPYEALKYAMGNDRFLYLVLQYSVFPYWSLSPEVFVQFVMPVVLSLLLMFSTFFLVRMGRSTFHAATAMLVTVCSFTVTVGLYGGFFANWLALVFAFVFYAFLIAAMKGYWKSVSLVLAGVMSVAVLYTHPWTWILLVLVNIVSYMVATVLLILSRRIEMHSGLQELEFMPILLGVNLLMFYVKGLIGVGGGGEIGGYVDVVQFGLSLSNVFRLGYFLNTTFDWYLGGFYAFAPVFLFAILGVFSFLDYKDRFNRLLLTWMLIASSMVFVAYPWQARFLYDMPFNIYTSFGILYGGEYLYRLVSSTELKRLASVVFVVFYVLSILFLFNYALRCVVLKQFGPPGLTALP